MIKILSSILTIFLMVSNFSILIAGEIPKSPYYPNSNEEWWQYQFDGYQNDPNHGPYDNVNCGPACSAMIINYLKNKGVTTTYHTLISAAYPDVHCYARWKYCQGNGHSPNGYYNTDWHVPGQPGATTAQIQYALSFEGIQTHIFTGNACKNDGTGITNLQNAIDQGKACICLVKPSCYRSDGTTKSHWVVAYGYDSSYIYLNDPGYRTGKGFKATKNNFGNALWEVTELSTVIVCDTRISGTPQEQTLFRAKGTDPVYWFQNEKLYHIANTTIAGKMVSLPGWNMWPDNVAQFQPSVLSQYQGYENFQELEFLYIDYRSNGILIKLKNTLPIYVMQNSKLICFTSAQELVQRGYSFADTILVTPELMEMFFNYVEGSYGGYGFSPGQGAPDFQTFRHFLECYGRNYDGIRGSAMFGEPINAVHGWGNGYIQDFRKDGNELAIMQSVSGNKAYAVYGAIWAKYKSLGGAESFLGYPFNDENDAQSTVVTHSTNGRYQTFEGGHIHWHAEGKFAGQAFETHGAIDGLYTSMKGAVSWLGFPITDEFINPNGYPESYFEDGFITTMDGINYDTSRSADLNGDFMVDEVDRDTLFAYWRTDGSAATTYRSPDINQDGIVNTIDWGIMNSQWSVVVPIELFSFTATPRQGLVALNWSTTTETNNYGFEVERSTDKLNFVKIGFVKGSGTTTTPQNYSFTDRNISLGTYYYRLKQIDTDGSFEYSNIIEVKINPPITFSLEQNYPNPFNSETIIQYQLPQRSWVTIKIFNLLGQEIRTLVNEQKDAGYFTTFWDGRDSTGREVASGIYLYKIRAKGFVQIKKMLLLR